MHMLYTPQSKTAIPNPKIGKGSKAAFDGALREHGGAPSEQGGAAGSTVGSSETRLVGTVPKVGGTGTLHYTCKRCYHVTITT